MDPKYANLPGIARDEPDCYETPDMIKMDERISTDDSDTVQKINVTTKEAFDKFSNHEINGKYADFSDSISKTSSIGYRVNNDDEFIYNYRYTNETQFQKYNRLVAELKSLKNDLESAKIESKVDKNEDNESNENNANDYNVSELLSEVENLQKQVATLHLDSLNSTINNANTINKQAKKKQLVDKVNEFKKLTSATSTTVGTTKSAEINQDANSIVFKIFNDADVTSIKSSAKINDINQRLNRLETLIDSKANKDLINSVCVNSENKTIFGVIENLNAKVNLIDTQSIDIIESRLQWMIQKLNQLNEKKTLFDDNEKFNKINDLYSKLVKWQEMFQLLPNIIERLSSLSELHQQASQFVSILNRLDNEQLLIKQKLEANVDVVKQIKSNFDGNLKSIEKNIENLKNAVQSK